MARRQTKSFSGSASTLTVSLMEHVLRSIYVGENDPNPQYEWCNNTEVKIPLIIEEIIWEDGACYL